MITPCPAVGTAQGTPHPHLEDPLALVERTVVMTYDLVRRSIVILVTLPKVRVGIYIYIYIYVYVYIYIYIYM